MRGIATEPWDQRHLQAEATQGPVASRDKGESIRYITAALYVLVCARMKGGIRAPCSTRRRRLLHSYTRNLVQMSGHTHVPTALRFVLIDLQSLVGHRTGMDVVEESRNFSLPGIKLRSPRF
jgi:hypothetical protein